MQRLEVSGAVRPIYRSLGVKRITDYVNLQFSADIALLRQNSRTRL